MLKVTDREMKNGCYIKQDRADLLKASIQISFKLVEELAVKVTDMQGNPINDVKVSISNRVEMIGRSYNTGRTGAVVCSYIFDGGEYTISAKKTGYFFEPISMNLPDVGSPEWKKSIEIRMLDATRIQRGIVLDTDGKPVSGVSVECLGGGYSITDNNGEFVLQNLPDCMVSLYTQTNESYGNAQVNKDSGDIVITMKSMNRMETQTQ